MAIYHLSVKTISRSAGRSATGAASYRSASRIVDERTGQLHDYNRKGGVESAELVLPAGAPEWASDRSALWNAAEQSETRKNSTVAREFEIALSAELPETERQRLAHDFAREIVERHGCAADVAIHAPGREGDSRNHHAHILCSTRRLGPEGFTDKTRELDDRKTGEVDYWRARFAELQNERLREAGIEARIDHRSLKAQGIEREPTVHQGPAATAMERRGDASDRGRINRAIIEAASARLYAARELGKIERELAGVDRQIIDTTTALGEALRAREERPRGVERQGPAVSARRFQAKPSVPPGPQRPDFEAMPIEQQVKAFDILRDRLAQQRQDKVSRIAGKALARHERRTQTARKILEAKPQPPKGLLARFQRQGYETALGQWQKDWQKAERLKAQAEKTRDQITYGTLYESVHKSWAQRVLERTEPELTRRVEAHRGEKRKEARQEQERAEVAREFKGMAAKRATQAHGYTDGSRQWQATPEPLREIIDEYNRQPKAAQERALAAWMCHPEKAKAIREMMDQKREHTRDLGLSR